MALTCPACRTELCEVRAATITGYCLLLDQCRQCGGIWCDKWELYPVSRAAAEAIDVDVEALCAPAARPPATLNCPRCGIPMKSFSDPSLPADARVKRCARCEGMWLNRGELRLWKRRGAAPDGRRKTTVATDPRPLGAAPKAPVVNLAEAIDAPSPLSEGEETPIAEGLARSGAWIALRLLLRWFTGL